MSDRTIRVERDGAVLYARHTSPPRGFLKCRFLLELRRLMAEVERDPAVRVVVFTGDAPGRFIGHTEIAAILGMARLAPPLPAAGRRLAAGGVRVLFGVLRRAPWLADALLSGESEGALVRNALLNMLLAFDAVHRCSKATIAAIDGVCIGGGFELALCCDIRLMAHAVERWIGAPEILTGLIPGFGGTQRLTRVVGPARALELGLTGRLLDALEADRMGLVRAIPGARFDVEVKNLAARLALRPPLAVAALKRAIYAAREEPLGRGLFIELAEVMGVLRTRDAQAGLRDYDALLQRELARPEAEQSPPSELAARMDRAELTAFKGE